jgi:hypothetical protein
MNEAHHFSNANGVAPLHHDHINLPKRFGNDSEKIIFRSGRFFVNKAPAKKIVFKDYFQPTRKKAEFKLRLLFVMTIIFLATHPSH